MKYPRMGRLRNLSLSIPMLNGGINYKEKAEYINDNQLSEAQNMWMDDGALKTRPTFCVSSRSNASLAHPLFGSCVFVSDTVCYCGENAVVLAYDVGDDGTDLCVMSEQGKYMDTFHIPEKGCAVVSSSNDDADFIVYTDTRIYTAKSGSLAEVSANKLYAPTVIVNATPYHYTDSTTYPARGTMMEGYNLYSNRYKVLFTSVASCGIHAVPKRIPDNSEIHLIYTGESGRLLANFTKGETHTTVYGGKTYTITAADYFVNVAWSDGQASGYGFPETTQSSTVEIDVEYDKGSVESIGVPSCGCWYGGASGRTDGTRVFLGGFGNINKAKIAWSDVGNPYYFSEDNYNIVGDSSEPVTAFGSQADMLVILKERSVYYARYAGGDVDAKAVNDGNNVDVAASGSYFPIRKLSDKVGCDCRLSVQSVYNRLVWLTSDGYVHTLATSNIYNDYNVVDIGDNIASGIAKKSTIDERKGAMACAFSDRFCLLVGNRLFLFNAKDYGFTNLSAYYKPENIDKNLAWWEWTLPDGIEQSADGKFGYRAAVVGGTQRLLMPVFAIREGRNTSYAQLFVLSTGQEVFSVGGDKPIVSADVTDVNEVSWRSDGTTHTVTVNDTHLPYIQISLVPSANRKRERLIYDVDGSSAASLRKIGFTQGRREDAIEQPPPGGTIDLYKYFNEYDGVCNIHLYFDGAARTECRINTLKLVCDVVDTRTDETHDSVPVADNGIYTVTYPSVVSVLTTKQYGFGSISAYKRVKTIHIDCETDKAELSQISDGKHIMSPFRIEHAGEVRMIPSNISRCRTFGMRLSSDKPIRVGGIEIAVEPFGVVR